MVYRAEVIESSHSVAVKQIDLEHELADLYEVSREIQILSECRLLQITEYLGCFVLDLKLWVIMEYADGGLLFGLLHDGPIADENLIAHIVHEILLALEYLHSQGKIHRDLKSQNILLTLAGHIKLTDFGVSTQLFSTLSRRNTTVGTPYWMSPEVIVNSSGGHTYEADVWSLGCCVYELCTGKPPLQDQHSPMQALRTISCYEKNSDVWEAVDTTSLDAFLPSLTDFLRRCMVVDPKSRPSAYTLLKHEFFTSFDQLVASSTLLSLILKSKMEHSQYQDIEEPAIGSIHQEKSPTKSIRFDFSTIRVESANCVVFTPPSLRQPLNPFESPYRPYTPKGYSSQRLQLIKDEFQKIVEKSNYKLNQRAKLTSSQQAQLIALNELMLKLFVPVQSTDNAQSKLLIGQHFKNILKELSKKSADSTKSQLSRSFLPSMFVHPHEQKPNRSRLGNTPMDDVERSLLSSWLESMSR